MINKAINYPARNSFTLITILLGFLTITSFTCIAQSTVVKGKIADADSGEPIPYANIVFKNTMIGTISDSTGYFQLTTREKFDRLLISAVGFFPQSVKVEAGTVNELNIALKEEVIDISEIKVSPDEGPIRALMGRIISAKVVNNPDKYSRFSYRKYTKWEYHLNHVGKGIIDSKAFRNNQSVFQSNADSTKFLPLYFSEQLVYNEVQRYPPKAKSTVIADKTSGIGVLNDLEISGYTSALDMEVNFYSNFINLFDQNFVSPLAENGWFYYKYFLSDSTVVDGRKQYKVTFIPRREGDKVFKGYLTADSRNFSLIEVDGTLSGASSLNFLKSMRLKSNYQMVNDTVPFYRRNQIDAVFDYIPSQNNPSKKHLSLYFSQAATIDSVTVNQPGDVQLTVKNSSYETIKLPGSDDMPASYWESGRLEPLNEHERMVTSVIETVNQIKFIRFANNLARMGMTGYYDFGKFEFGPYANVFNFNKLEGVHIFAGLRTSSEISTKFMVWGGLGYGFDNRKINGIFGAGYKFPTIFRQMLMFSYDDKIVRSGENEKILNLYENMLSPTENNLVSQFFTRDEFDELYREQKAQLKYEHEWYPGLLHKIGASYVRHYSPPFYPFLQGGNPLGSVAAADFYLDTRLSWKEKLIDDRFMRVYMSSDYPIIHLTVGGGKVFYGDQSNFYGKLLGTIKQGIYFGQAYLHYAVEGGVYFGKLPYTMLDIPRGNETVGYFSYDFNLMNYMEFIHDKYINAYVEYHLNGFLFNRVPGLKKAGLREVFSAKGMVGSLSNKHRDIVDFPVNISESGVPYLEVGAGIENIFRLFRVEAIWRVTPSSKQGAPVFGVRAKFELKL